jgi:hypothetical protein
MKADRAGRVARAKAYPFAIPGRSYLYVNGDSHELVAHGACPVADGTLDHADGPRPVPDHLADAGIEAGPGIEGRTPVIASGSNQSPDQLRRKFGALPGDVVIPVSRCRLAEFDAIYSAHFSRYGSIAATLQHSPGTTVTLMVTWLTPDQLGHMHDTEARGENYAYVRLDGLVLMLDGGMILEVAYAYASLHGCLTRAGRPVALREVAAEGRAFDALDQTAIQAHARDRLAPGDGLDEFILANIEDRQLRRDRTARLRADAAGFEWPNRRTIEN